MFSMVFCNNFDTYFRNLLEHHVNMVDHPFREDLVGQVDHEDLVDLLGHLLPEKKTRIIS